MGILDFGMDTGDMLVVWRDDGGVFILLRGVFMRMGWEVGWGICGYHWDFENG